MSSTLLAMPPIWLFTESVMRFTELWRLSYWPSIRFIWSESQNNPMARHTPAAARLIFRTARCRRDRIRGLGMAFT